MRDRIPNRRGGETWTMDHHGLRYTITASRSPDGRFVECFLAPDRWTKAGKSGSDLEPILRDAGIIVSLALQHGCPLDELRHAITRDDDGRAASPLGTCIDALHDAAAPPTAHCPLPTAGERSEPR